MRTCQEDVRMPAHRRRYDDETGRPLPCVVKLPPAVAAVVYRETLARGFGSETELVVHVMRAWAEVLAPMNWPETLAQLRSQDAADGQAPKAG
jgi:hypothetical protein